MGATACGTFRPLAGRPMAPSPQQRTRGGRPPSTDSGHFEQVCTEPCPRADAHSSAQTAKDCRPGAWQACLQGETLPIAECFFIAGCVLGGVCGLRINVRIMKWMEAKRFLLSVTYGTAKANPLA